MAYQVRRNLIKQLTSDAVGWQAILNALYQPTMLKLECYWGTVLGGSKQPPGKTPTINPTLVKEFWLSPSQLEGQGFAEELCTSMFNQEIQDLFLLTCAWVHQPVQIQDIQQLIQTPGGNLLMGQDTLDSLPAQRVPRVSIVDLYQTGLRLSTVEKNFPENLVYEFQDVGHLHFPSLNFKIKTLEPMNSGMAARVEATLNWGFSGRFAIKAYEVISANILKDSDSKASTPSEAERKQWIKDGRCPQCGVLGPMDACGGVRCPTHGPYQMEV